jgi:phage-related protein (TIGR01555 family)
VRRAPVELTLDAAAVPEKATTYQEAVQIMDQQVVPGVALRDLDQWARAFDSYASSTTGIGQPGMDKRLSHHMQVPTITYQGAIAIYRGDKMAERAIEAPIRECFRQGYEINIADEGRFDDLKEAIEDKISELELNDVIQRAMFYERAYGGSAILLGVDDGKSLDEPLDLSKVTKLEWLNVLESIELFPATYYDQIGPNYGEVELYELHAFVTFGAASAAPINPLPSPNINRIHSSRLIVFPGKKVSRYQVQTGLAGVSWGDSILIALVDALRDFNVSWSAAGLLAVDFGQPVISVQNLMMLVAKNPGDFMARMRALEEGRSTARAILIDKDKEKFERQNTNVTGFPDLLNALSMRLAATVDMPLTLLMGQSPKGLGNEGESDVRFYYDRIKGRQTTEVGPLLLWFVKLIMRTLRQRKLPKKVTIKFAELWQMTAAETAQAHLTQARTDSMYIKSGVVFPDEIRKSRFRGGYSFDTTIDERKKAPGFAVPPPQGTPGSPHNPGAGGPPAGPNAHAVGGYVRKNPASSGTEPAAKQGGDVVPRNRDEAQAPVRTDIVYLADRLRGMQNQRAAALADQLACLLDSDGPGEHVVFAGFPITIESPRGSKRCWTEPDGTAGETLMKYDYGYIEGAAGADGDCVDVYLGDDPAAAWVYIVHQAASPDFVRYDEDKVMLGFPSGNAAHDAYLEQYNDPRYFGGMTMLAVETFRHKVFAGAGQVTAAAA